MEIEERDIAQIRTKESETKTSRENRLRMHKVIKRRSISSQKKPLRKPKGKPKNNNSNPS